MNFPTSRRASRGTKATASMPSSSTTSRSAPSSGAWRTSAIVTGSGAVASGVHGECPSTAFLYGSESPRAEQNRMTMASS